MVKLLIVEDEAPLLLELVDYLSGMDYLCESAASFSEAEDKIALYDYDIVLLDLMLPGGNGLSLLRQLKKKNARTGVLILSAKDSLDDKLTGLDLGADDYITKPFHLSEINARIHALIRRKHFQGSEVIHFGAIGLDVKAQTVNVEGQNVELTKKEYDLLLFFIINKNRVLSKRSIAEHLWGDDYDMADNYDFVYVHVKNLRKKLLAAGSPDYLKTIYGMGYKFSEA
ncbi:MAG: response regulator transcription factor [Bacteroidia bacterium]